MAGDKIKKTISEKLNSLREDSGLTQLELAEKAGLNSNAYAKVERGDQMPTIETLLKIAMALDVRSSDILPR